jgi:DNA end-binding protein Ku
VGLAAMAASYMEGSISFGLVNIPIQVFSATQKEDYISFSQLCEKGHKIKYKKWCPVEEREVPWSEIKKGYEITKNNYVVLEKEEIENIKLKTTNTVEVKEFIESEEFDPIFIEKNYYVGPDPGKKKVESSTRAYSLLVKILNETNKVAIGKVVLREKEHLVALRAYQRGLVMHQLRYLDEIRPMDEIGNLDSLQKVDSKELSLGKTLVENLTTEKFDPGQYSDSYAKELEKLIEAKSKGQEVVPQQAEEKPEETTDIIEALKASLKVKGKSSTSTAAKAKGKMGIAVSK